MERYILHNSITLQALNLKKPYLPKSILWRQKEQFSDGVGYSWIDGYVLGTVIHLLTISETTIG